MHTLKVCIVTEHFSPHIGGVETMFSEYSQRLAMAGCQVKVLTSSSGGVTGVRKYGEVDVEHHPWPALFGHPMPRAVDLQAAVKSSDIVHTTTYTAAPTTLAVARKYGKP